jgi:hydroxymethylpyrimidine/phosphomethylpyrimidine kinase
VVPPTDVAQQMDSVLGDLGVDALKTGMLPTPECVSAVAAKLRQYQVPNVVVDPVLVSTSGATLAQSECMLPLRDELFPLGNSYRHPRRQSSVCVRRKFSRCCCCFASRISSSRPLSSSSPKVGTIGGGRGDGMKSRKGGEPSLGAVYTWASVPCAWVGVGVCVVPNACVFV